MGTLRLPSPPAVPALRVLACPLRYPGFNLAGGGIDPYFLGHAAARKLRLRVHSHGPHHHAVRNLPRFPAAKGHLRIASRFFAGFISLVMAAMYLEVPATAAVTKNFSAYALFCNCCRRMGTRDGGGAVDSSFVAMLSSITIAFAT